MAYTYYKIFSSTGNGRIIGLDHLEGLTASVIMDGAYIGDFVVTGGLIDLPAGVTADYEVIVGLKYTSELETQPMGFFTPSGPVYGNKKRIAAMGVYLYQSLGLSYQLAGRPAYEIEFRTLEDEAAYAPSLFTGFKRWNTDGNYDEETTVKVTQTKPYPLNINLLQITTDLTN